MKVTIDNVIPFTDYSVQGKPVIRVDVHYTINDTYHGTKRMLKDEYDPKTIHSVCAADAAQIIPTIGKTVVL
jgi:hypothetical protein